MPQHVATRRDHVACRKFFNLRDMARDRSRRHEIDLTAERCFFLLAVDVPLGAVALQTPCGSGVTGLGVKIGDLVDGQRVFSVEGRRDTSGLVALAASFMHVSLTGGWLPSDFIPTSRRVVVLNRLQRPVATAAFLGPVARDQSCPHTPLGKPVEMLYMCGAGLASVSLRSSKWTRLYRG